MRVTMSDHIFELVGVRVGYSTMKESEFKVF